MKMTFIYSLNCPITGRSRYLGKADDPYTRYGEHVSCNHKRKTYKENWIRSLLLVEETPQLEVLDEVPESEWPFWEKEWIRLYLALGFKLTNATAGGEGGATFLNKKHSSETILKQRAAKLGKKHSIEAILNMMGREESLETRAKKSAAKLGIPKSPSHRAAISAARLGKKFPRK